MITRNPSTCFMQWEGSTGRFKYWDKETQTNVYIGHPFTFVVLDTLCTVKGWSDRDNSSIWSNEVRNTAKDYLKVQTRTGVKGVGLYQNLKTRVTGMQYTQSVYIAYKRDGELVIGNFQMKGSALTQWIDFVNGIGNGGAMKAIQFSGVVEGTKGANTFFKPTFKLMPISSETERECVRSFGKLSSYLSEYLKRNAEEDAVTSSPAQTITNLAVATA